MSYSDSNLKKSSIETSNNNAEPKGSELSKALFNTNKEQCSLATLFWGYPQAVLPTTVEFQVILYQHTSCPHLTDHLKSLVLQVELESSYSSTKIRQHLRPQPHPTKLVFKNPFFFLILFSFYSKNQNCNIVIIEQFFIFKTFHERKRCTMHLPNVVVLAKFEILNISSIHYWINCL